MPGHSAESQSRIQKDEDRSFSATTLHGSAALPFVISTEAQRSGEISVWMLLLGNVFDGSYPGRFLSAARKSSTGLVFSTSSFVSQARRNCLTP
jgi:hypothetical protein